MKTARLFTSLGSILLVITAAFHTSRYPRLLQLMQKNTISWPASGILKASWLTFSILLFALAVIAFLARNMERGGPLVLIAAAANVACAVILWRFLGFFPGVYLLTAVTVFLTIGGWLQLKDKPLI
jgi:hypothetical protein